MNIRELRVFVRAYDQGSLTGAANEGFISRQAVSKSIRHLEAQLGGSLFVREARGVRPTDLARAVYPHARQVVDGFDAIEAEARHRASGIAGCLTLAVESNAAMTLPAGVFAAYGRSRPDACVRMRAMPSETAVAAFLSGEVDALLAGPLDGRHVRDSLVVAFEPVISSSLTIVFSRKAFGPELEAASDAGVSAIPCFTSGLMTGGTANDAPASRFVALDVEFLAGKTVFGVSPTNFVERQLIPFLEGRGIDTVISYDYPDTALATREMEAGAGGVIVESDGAVARFCGDEYVHVPLVGDGAPLWEVGVSYWEGSACAPMARDLASFIRA